MNRGPTDYKFVGSHPLDTFPNIPCEQEDEAKKLQNPTTYPALMKYLHRVYVSRVAEKLKKNNDLNSGDFWNDPDLKALIRDSGLSKEKQPKEKTVKKIWVPEARKMAKILGKRGAKKRNIKN